MADGGRAETKKAAHPLTIAPLVASQLVWSLDRKRGPSVLVSIGDGLHLDVYWMDDLATPAQRVVTADGVETEVTFGEAALLVHFGDVAKLRVEVAERAEAWRDSDEYDRGDRYDCDGEVRT